MTVNAFPLPRFNDEPLHHEFVIFQKHLARNVPIGRLADPRESADLALFLASEQSNFIIGQIIPFAGGWTTSTG